MYSYTKEQVQEFLGSQSSDNQTLKRGLNRRGFEVGTNNKRGANLLFILDKELVDPMMEEFGFKPTRPETTRALLKAFHDFGGQLNMGWSEVANHIKATQGLDIHHSNLSRAYKELADNEKVNPMEAYVVINSKGTELTVEERVAFDKYIAELRQAYDGNYMTFQLALNKFGYRNVKRKEIGAY